MLNRHPPRVMYHPVYEYTKSFEFQQMRIWIAACADGGSGNRNKGRGMRVQGVGPKVIRVKAENTDDDQEKRMKVACSIGVEESGTGIWVLSLGCRAEGDPGAGRDCVVWEPVSQGE